MMKILQDFISKRKKTNEQAQSAMHIEKKNPEGIFTILKLSI